jgi:hypothetical protein
MTFPQGIWQAENNIITPVTFSGISPVYTQSSSSGVIIGNSVASTLNGQKFSLTKDFTTSYVVPGSTAFVASQVFLSFPYQPTPNNGVIQIQLFISTATTLTGQQSYGAAISLYTSSVVGAPSIYANTQRNFANSGVGLNSSTFNFTYNLSRSTLPSTINFYLCGGSGTTGPSVTFISNTSQYFGGTSGCYAIVNSAI